MGLPTILPYNMPGAEDLPENKVAWELDSGRSVLLIHDMQKYFLNAYRAEQSPVVELVEHIKQLKRECKKLGIPVVYTAQPGDQDPKDRALLQDFWGSGLKDDPSQTGIVDELAPEEDDLVLTKWRYSAFQRTELMEYLKSEGRDQMLVCGVYAHIGCLLTSCDAFMQDIQPFFIADAVADFSYEEHLMAMKYAASRCGFVAGTHSVLSALKDEEAGEPSITMDVMKKQVAELLDEQAAALSETENLIDRGLDSIRLMSLVEEWRESGADVDFMKLSETPTLSHWWRLVSESTE